MNSLNFNPSHCDNEQGVVEYESAPGVESLWVYRSSCSVPHRIWDQTFHIRQTGDCSCGCGEAGFWHPCIGHDQWTGEPLEGPSLLWRRVDALPGVYAGGPQ